VQISIFAAPKPLATIATGLKPFGDFGVAKPLVLRALGGAFKSM